MISPLLVTNDNDLSNKYATSNADKSATLSAQFVSKRTMNPIFQISISHLTITTSFSPFHISVVINHKFISSFANKFNISSDGLSKSLAHELNVPLCFIFNYILDSGFVDFYIWKKFNIIPIYKKDDYFLSINYMPINILLSLLLLLSKSL